MSPAHAWLPRLVFAVLCIAIFLPVAAFAQTTDGVVDLSPVIDILVWTIGGALSALAGWALLALSKLLGLKSDSEYRQYVQDAVNRGIDYAVNRAAEYARQKSKIPVRSEAIEIAVEYVLRAVPDGVKQLGLDRERVRAMVDARLPSNPTPP
jgi:hypothetical protein